MADLAPRLSAEELSHIWGRPVAWVRLHAVEFGGFKVGGQWRFNPDDIARYEARHKGADPLSMTPLSSKRQTA